MAEKEIDSAQIIADLKEFVRSTNAVKAPGIERMCAELLYAGGAQMVAADEETRGSGRSSLTFPVSRNYCNSQINKFLVAPFGIVVNAKTSDVKEAAETATGIIRGIEVDSDGLAAYGLAVDRQVKCGLGYAAVTTDYSNNDNFDQVVKIEAIVNPKNVVFDRFSIKSNGSDANKVAVLEYIPEKKAIEDYGESVKDASNSACILGDTTWKEPKDTVAMVTFYERKNKKERLYAVDGKMVPESEGLKSKSAKSRMASKPYVIIHKICGNHVISSTEYPLSFIPVIPFYGERIDTENGLDAAGFIYWGKSSFQMINYAANDLIEQMVNAPKPTKVAAAAGVMPYIDLWERSNKYRNPLMLFNHKDDKGNDIPPPFEMNGSPDISVNAAALTGFKDLASDILGIPIGGVAAGISSNETAEAVLTRTKTVEQNNYQYMLNAKESIKQVGRCVLEAAILVNDTERELTVSNKDGISKRVINLSDLGLSLSKVDIDVDSGPMMASQRKENVNGLVALGGMLGPETSAILAPDIARNSEFQGSEAIAAKLDVIANRVLGAGNNEIPPEAQAAMQAAESAIQAQQLVIDQANIYIQQLQGELANSVEDTKRAVLTTQMNNENRLEVEAMKLQGKANETQAKILADAEAQTRSLQADLTKEILTRPETVVVQGVKPDYTSVGGQKNALP